MLYEVSFELNGVYCANLVETNNGMETAKEYFIQEKLDGDRSRFCGISEHYGLRKPGMPIHTVPDGWKEKKSKKLVLVDILCVKNFWNILRFPRLPDLDLQIMIAESSAPELFCSICWKHRKTRFQI